MEPLNGILQNVWKLFISGIKLNLIEGSNDEHVRLSAEEKDVCLEALPVVADIARPQLDANDIKALRLTCRTVKRGVDELIHTLKIDGNELNFHLLSFFSPGQLTSLDISPETWEARYALREHIPELSSFIKLCAPTLSRFAFRFVGVRGGGAAAYASQWEVVLSSLANTAWPRLVDFTIELPFGHLSELQLELESMKKLRSINFNLGLNATDIAVLAGAVFTPKLTRLSLLYELQTEEKEALSKATATLLERAERLRELELTYPFFSMNCFRRAPLQALEQLTLKQCYDVPTYGPMFHICRPNLRCIIFENPQLATQNLAPGAENSLKYLFAAGSRLPGLKSLKIDVGLHEDWSFISSMNLTSLESLDFRCSFSPDHLFEHLGLAAVAGKLPHLKELFISWGRLFNLGVEYLEKLLDSPVISQLEMLCLPDLYLTQTQNDGHGLAVFERYAENMHNLKVLEIHGDPYRWRKRPTIDGIARIGRRGQCRKLERLQLCTYSGWVVGEEKKIEALLHPIWGKQLVIELKYV